MNKEPIRVAERTGAVPVARKAPRFLFQSHGSVMMRDHRPCGLMDEALVFGTKDCRLESCQNQGVGKARGLSVTDAACSEAGARHAIAACARPRALPRQMGSVMTCSGGARYPLRPRCGPQAPLLTPHIAGRLKLDRHARQLAKDVFLHCLQRKLCQVVLWPNG